MKSLNTYCEIDIRCEVTSFTPPRPAPICSNHDDPKFSDCGDDGFLEFNVFFVFNGRDFPAPEEFYATPEFDLLYEEVYDACMSALCEYDD
jgi:hypothetical protein